jgi:hypothetical protein
MRTTFIELSEDAFNALFPLLTNDLNPSASWGTDHQGGCLFETYGEELEFVRRQHRHTVWTLVDGNDGDQHLINGLKLVNRIGFVINTEQVPAGTDIQVRIPMEDADAADNDESDA